MSNTNSNANGKDKAGRFMRVAEKRVSMTLDNIRRVGNLSNTSTYAFEPNQVEQMFSAMRGELDAAEQRFYASKKMAQQTFSFGG
jgi:hypothetical protein